MASISVTHTFTNSTTADATQVNTNFTDIINGTSDGSKDFSISALTCAGNFTANGTTNTLGSASNDDLVINASLASSVALKTTFTYDIGTNAIGLRDIYLADAGSAARATKIRGATIGSAWTLTLPTGAGSAGQGVRNLGSGSLAFLPVSPDQIDNIGLTATVAVNALTIALKGADGNDPSATNPVYVAFRNATAATGTPSVVAATAATSLVISSGSTLGHASAVNQYVYVYLINNAGTIELAACGQKEYDEGSILTTTAEGAAGAADSGHVLYSTSARSNVACRYIGRLKSNQATAGTWATAISEISLFPSDRKLSQRSCVHVYAGNGHGSGSTKIRRFSSTDTSIGAAITYADSSTLGGTFTINEDGVYGITYQDARAGGATAFGVSRNSSQLTTNLGSITATDVLTNCNAATALYQCCAGTFVLRAGDVIRAHTNATPDETTMNVRFCITKISD